PGVEEEDWPEEKGHDGAYRDPSPVSGKGFQHGAASVWGPRQALGGGSVEATARLTRGRRKWNVRATSRCGSPSPVVPQTGGARFDSLGWTLDWSGSLACELPYRAAGRRGYASSRPGPGRFTT